MPGWRISNSLRYWAVKRVLKQCGKNIRVKDHCYFGDGSRLSIGDDSSLGVRASLGGAISIGNDVNMGPDVTMMSGSHETRRISLPITFQGAKEDKPIKIGNDVWIGAKVIILPGVKIGDRVIIGAGSVIRSNIPHYAVVAGNPAKIVGFRFSPDEIEEYESKLPVEKRHDMNKIRKMYEKYYINRKEEISSFVSI